ncbi:T9SS type A sorting domain-containing protein [Fluviicola sp. SGL-29]|nr:T9SS type A sorting domain-containing protein [Fluviicola sp. SGL-29]
MKRKLLFGLVLSASLSMPFTGNSQAFTENFDNITTLTGSGWFQQNNSSPVGTNPVWFQGNPPSTGGPFIAYNGADNAYIACNFNSTAGGSGTISNWLVTPNRTFRNGDVITFYTRKYDIGQDYPDRMEVRLSANGASTNVGTGATAVGDFTTLLTSINPSLIVGGYPRQWTLYTITISGLPAPTSGRIAFRYFVTGAGPTGTNSDYIGLDNVVYTPYTCPAFTMTAGGALTGGVAGSAYSNTLTQTGALGAPNFAVTMGALPPGLTLAANGTISGTPTATGTFNFTATVNDASGCSGSQSYSITVVCPANPISIAAFPALCSNDASYTLTQGSPAGGTYSGTGVSSGQFDPAVGTQTITYDYTDPYGCAHSGNAPITVNNAPVVDAGADQIVCDGDAVTLNGSGANSYMWDNSVTDGVAFTPAVGTVLYTVTGTDANGCMNTDDVSVTVNALPVVDGGADQTVCEGTAVTLSGSGADSYMWDNSVTDGVAFTPATGTMSYTVTGTDVNGCMNTDDVSVTVNALPLVNAGADQTVCAGDDVTLSGSGADSYGWDNSVTDGVAFTPAVGTVVYTVTGTDANGCTNTDDVSVTVNPIPTVTFAALANACVTHAPITLTQGMPAGGTYSGAGVSGGSFNPATAGVGTHTITYTVIQSGCEGTAQSSITVDACLGIQSESVQTLSIFPNPATSELNVVFENTSATDVRVVMETMDGKVVYQTAAKALSVFNDTINVSDFSNGIYFIRIESGAVSLVQRVILN